MHDWGQNCFWDDCGDYGGDSREEVSPVEVVEAHLERVAEMQPKLNAFVHLDVEGARRQARAAEAAVMRGDRWGRCTVFR